MKLINKGRRRIGVPVRPALVLNPGEAVPISTAQMEMLHDNKTTARWLESGVLALVDEVAVEIEPVPITPKRVAVAKTKVDRDQREEVTLPEDVTGTGVEISHGGGGWYQVFVNGFKVTDKNVRKDEAETIASEYE